MPWLPTRTLVWESRLGRDDLIERLRPRTHESWFRPAPSNKWYVGTVGETAFCLVPRIGVLTAILAQVSGTFDNVTEVDTANGSSPSDKRTRITLVVTPGLAMQAAMVVAFGIMSAAVYYNDWARVFTGTAVNAFLVWYLLRSLQRLVVTELERKLAALFEATPAIGVSSSNSSLKWPAWPIVPVAILIAACAWGNGVVQGHVGLMTRPMVELFVTAWVAQALLLAWLTWCSRLNALTRTWLLGLGFGIELAWCWPFVVAFYTGDGRPVFTWRWSPPPGKEYAIAPENAMVAGPRSESHAAGARDFPQFRGRNRDGIVTGVRLRTDWTTTPPRIVWKQQVGLGWSAFAVAGNLAVTMEQRDDEEAVVAYDVDRGSVAWEHRYRAHFVELMGGSGPRSTPTIDGDYVYALGATGKLTKLAVTTGEKSWQVDAFCGEASVNSPFGSTGSPLVADGLVIVGPGGKQGSLAAFDVETGQLKWDALGPPAAYASPMMVSIGGVRQILHFNTEGIYAHQPSDGKVLWSYPWYTPPEKNNVCQPVPWRDDDEKETVFIASGYGKGGALLDVTNNDGVFQPTPRWFSRQLKPKFTSVVEREGYVYGLDEAILCCIDLRTGQRQWKGGRYGYGQLLLVGESLLIQSENGAIAICDASPKAFHERARLDVLNERTWSHLALAGRSLLMRSDRTAACVELPAELIDEEVVRQQTESDQARQR
jgi:outer membrane protein assembly factor BamB